MRALAKPLLGLLLLLGIAIPLAFFGMKHFPTPPQAPRYEGANNASPQAGGVFRFAEGSNVRTLDPHIGYDTLSWAAMRLLFDSLIDYDFEGNFIPSLAAALPEISSAGKVFRFKLREGIRFHNGDELSAQDVAWSMHRLLAYETGSPGYGFFKAIVGAEAYHHGKADRIRGIRVISKYEIEFELEEPDQTFLNALAMPFAAPLSPRAVNAREANEGASAVGREPIGTGPFQLASWERGVELRFKRFDAYWQSRPRVAEIVFMENTEGYVAGARFRNGDLDILYRPNKVDLLFFHDAAAWQPYLSALPTPSVYAITMNCELEPFDNPHVRRAVAYAIDRKKIWRLDRTRVTPAHQLLPPMLPGHDPEQAEQQRYDLERARHEMKLAGYPNGLSEPVQFWVRGDGEAKFAQLFQQDLKAIGIEVELKQVSFATYLKEAGKPRVVQMALTGWHQDFPDPSNFMDPLFHTRAIHPENSENKSFYRNPAFDALLDRGRAETDRQKRIATYQEASIMLSKDAPWAFLYYPLDTFVWQPYVKNFKPHPVWLHHYRDIWLDLPRRRVQETSSASRVSSLGSRVSGLGSRVSDSILGAQL